MASSLQLSLDNQVGALERLLRVTRHRGFQVRHFAADYQNRADRIEVSMQVESGRPLMNLIAQLAKQVEVRSLQVKHSPVRVQ
ncbi:acetolactate synthase 2 small subunit [Chitinimonas lacunae]|uniref:Acetolactate synthase 2 small subunit n=1 Tax=Chitinimonas lacunae TaxID=1963018 RepID=A0ABV8MTL6_9NEIS